MLTFRSRVSSNSQSVSLSNSMTTDQKMSHRVSSCLFVVFFVLSARRVSLLQVDVQSREKIVVHVYSDLRM